MQRSQSSINLSTYFGMVISYSQWFTYWGIPEIKTRMFTGPTMSTTGAFMVQAGQQRHRFWPCRRCCHECHPCQSSTNEGRFDRICQSYCMIMFLLMQTSVSQYTMICVMLSTLSYFCNVIQDMWMALQVEAAAQVAATRDGTPRRCKWARITSTTKTSVLLEVLILPFGELYQVQTWFLSCNVSKYLQLELQIYIGSP